MCKGVDKMPFETPFSPIPGLFDATITSFQHELGGVAPNTIIRTDQAWHIHLSWQTTGIATSMIGGSWHVHAYLESVGPGNDVNLVDPGDHVIPLTPGVSPVNYNIVLDVGPNVVGLPPGTGMNDTGLYKLVVALTYIDLANAPGPMAAFEEGPMLQFYNP
jgi:hypothetical protein